jgi:hypothetical protein
VNTTPGAAAAADSAGVSGVMPLTPESTFVTRTASPLETSAR